MSEIRAPNIRPQQIPISEPSKLHERTTGLALSPIQKTVVAD